MKISFYSASFDESYVFKQEQMDFHIRYWNSKTEYVNVLYLNSSIMGKSLANDVFEHFDSCIESIDNKTML